MDFASYARMHSSAILSLGRGANRKLSLTFCGAYHRRWRNARNDFMTWMVTGDGGFGVQLPATHTRGSDVKQY